MAKPMSTTDLDIPLEVLRKMLDRFYESVRLSPPKSKRGIERLVQEAHKLSRVVTRLGRMASAGQKILAEIQTVCPHPEDWRGVVSQNYDGRNEGGKGQVAYVDFECRICKKTLQQETRPLPVCPSCRRPLDKVGEPHHYDKRECKWSFVCSSPKSKCSLSGVVVEIGQSYFGD